MTAKGHADPAAGGSAAIVSRIHDAATGVTEVKLTNGITALLLVQSDSPVVSVQTWYRVGSREEEKGHTGLAHFLEHLLFKGTKLLRKGDIDLVTLRNGGQNNADTTYDRTRYYFHLSADCWERGLEIEADRMRGSAFDEYEFEAERGPVLEELRRDHDDPWWRLHEAMDSTAFLSHPYHNPVIGWPDEVTVVPREDVLRFYDRWYQPGNCTLVIVGGFDADRAVVRIADLFGPIPGAPVPEKVVPQEPQQEGERRFELELDVQVPKMLAAFHTVRSSDPDDLVLDVTQAILSAGKASRLYERLVRKDGLVREISAWNDSRRDPGLFMMMMELNEGADRAVAEAALWDEIAALGREGPAPDELDRARSMISASLVYRRATASGMAELLGSLHLIAGDWRLVRDIEARTLAVSAEDVQRVVKAFLRRANRSVGWVVPRPADAAPRSELPANGHHDLDDPPEENRDEPEILRRVPPRRAAIVLPVRRIVLPNGLRLLLMRRGGAPTVSFRVLADAGILRERIPGVATFAGDCLDEGAGGRSGPDIARFMESRGATLGVGALGASSKCLVRDVDGVLDVLADVIRRPDFPQDAVDRKRTQLISELLAEDDDPATIGRHRLRAEVYGEHPYARRDKGSLESLKGAGRAALLDHHRSLFVPSNTLIACVGDLDVAKMEDLLRARFGDWPDAAAPFPPIVPPPPPGPAHEIELREDRDQLHLFLGHIGVRRTDPDYHALLVGDLVLGSGAGFTDRLSKKLRDEMGLAYTVTARIARGSDLEPGMFFAYIGTSPQQRETARKAMLAEIVRFLDEGPTDREVEDAKSFLLGSSVFAYETNDGTADQICHFEKMGLGFDEPTKFAETVSALTPKAVDAAARRHIFPDKLVTVVVGKV